MKNKKEKLFDLYDVEECKEIIKDIEEEIIYTMKNFKISNNPRKFEKDLEDKRNKLKDLNFNYMLYYNFINKGELN